MSGYQPTKELINNQKLKIMYLVSTLNSQLDGWEIVASGTKKELELELDALGKSVWYNKDGSQKAFSDIYADTMYKNAKIVSKEVAKRDYKINKYDYSAFIEREPYF